MKAICAGNGPLVRQMLHRSPALVPSTDPESFGATPLIHAACRADLPMIDLLLHAGAPIDGRSDWWAGGFTALDSGNDAVCEHLLARGATLTPHAAAKLGRTDALRAMLERDPDLVHARGGDGQLPLHSARTPEIVDLLLAHGAEIDARDIDHASTAAQWAAPDRPDVARRLVERGAEADLFLACMIGDASLVERLLDAEPDGVNARITPERFPAPRSEALGIYHYTIGTDATPLHAAARAGQAETIRLLVARGAHVNTPGGYDNGVPLHNAAWHDRVAAAEALLDAGAEIDRRSGRLHNNTPLGWAIVAGSERVVDLFIRRGARIDAGILEDARAGASGMFRGLKRDVPAEAWTRIHARVGAARA